MAIMVLVVPMPSAAAIAIARMIGGKQNTRSVRRISASSAQPRMYAATAPSKVPNSRAGEHHDEADSERDPRAVDHAA